MTRDTEKFICRIKETDILQDGTRAGSRRLQCCEPFRMVLQQKKGVAKIYEPKYMLKHKEIFNDKSQ